MSTASNGPPFTDCLPMTHRESPTQAVARVRPLRKPTTAVDPLNSQSMRLLCIALSTSRKPAASFRISDSPWRGISAALSQLKCACHLFIRLIPSSQLLDPLDTWSHPECEPAERMIDAPALHLLYIALSASRKPVCDSSSQFLHPHRSCSTMGVDLLNALLMHLPCIPPENLLCLSV